MVRPNSNKTTEREKIFDAFGVFVFLENFSYLPLRGLRGEKILGRVGGFETININIFSGELISYSEERRKRDKEDALFVFSPPFFFVSFELELWPIAGSCREFINK